MQTFLWTSIVGSIILTLLLNVLPWLFPTATKNIEQKVHEKIEESFKDNQDGTLKRPRMQIYFPWKFMLAVSLVLTIVMNLVSFLSR